MFYSFCILVSKLYNTFYRLEYYFHLTIIITTVKILLKKVLGAFILSEVLKMPELGI